MKQKNFTTTRFKTVTKRTRKRKFLDEMNLHVPCSELVELIEPHAPSGKPGRAPLAAATILRIHFVLEWFAMCASWAIAQYKPKGAQNQSKTAPKFGDN